MADLFSKSQFREAVSELSGTSYFSNTLNESRDAVNFGYWKRKIFLSHSHYDAQYVNMARKFFESLGIEIYVDWADESMPVKTCVETAVKIKQKIAENDFFILLATNNALKSKWCNWEVGIGDTYKLSSNHIAIHSCPLK